MWKDVLKSCLSDLRFEKAETEKRRSRETLKEQEVFLKDVLKRLEAA